MLLAKRLRATRIETTIKKFSRRSRVECALTDYFLANCQFAIFFNVKLLENLTTIYFFYSKSVKSRSEMVHFP